MIKFTDTTFESFEGYIGDYSTGIYTTVFDKDILFMHAYSHRVSKENYPQILTKLFF
jgi:hypothetical protein